MKKLHKMCSKTQQDTEIPTSEHRYLLHLRSLLPCRHWFGECGPRVAQALPPEKEVEHQAERRRRFVPIRLFPPQPPQKQHSRIPLYLPCPRFLVLVLARCRLPSPLNAGKERSVRGINLVRTIKLFNPLRRPPVILETGGIRSARCIVRKVREQGKRNPRQHRIKAFEKLFVRTLRPGSSNPISSGEVRPATLVRLILPNKPLLHICR